MSVKTNLTKKDYSSKRKRKKYKIGEYQCIGYTVFCDGKKIDWFNNDNDSYMNSVFDFLDSKFDEMNLEWWGFPFDDKVEINISRPNNCCKDISENTKKYIEENILSRVNLRNFKHTINVDFNYTTKQLLKNRSFVKFGYDYTDNLKPSE